MLSYRNYLNYLIWYFLTLAIIYQGQTKRCHPNFKFSEEFNITHSVNHLPKEEKAIKLIEKVLLPYVKNKKEELDLRSTEKRLLITDVFKGPWTDKVKSLVEKHHGKMAK